MTPIVKLVLCCVGAHVIINKGGNKSKRAAVSGTAAPAGTGRMRHGSRLSGMKKYKGPRAAKKN